MKLIYSPGSCSLAVHIALIEAEIPFTLELVNREARTTEHLAAHPLGSVPTLLMDQGKALTETSAILQWVGDQKPDKKLSAPAGSWESYKLRETLNFLSTEVHKNFGPFFAAKRLEIDEKAKQAFLNIYRESLLKRFEILDQRLGAQSYLMGNHYTVADMYLFVLQGWTKMIELDISRFKNVAAFTDRVGDRPAVRKAKKDENIT